MICPRCDANNDNSENYCYLCGLKLDSAAQEQPLGGVPMSPPAPPPPVLPTYNSYGTPPMYGNPGDFQPPYGAQPYPSVQPTSNAAIISLVAGIISWIALPFVSAIVAVIAGHMAHAEIRRSGNTVGGGGMALAGLILGYLNVLIVLGFICIAVVLVVLAAGNTSP